MRDGHEKPVYKIEVCKFKCASSCPLSSTTAWVAFDEWLGEDEHGRRQVTERP